MAPYTASGTSRATAMLQVPKNAMARAPRLAALQ
jgi:hypothetical protein